MKFLTVEPSPLPIFIPLGPKYSPQETSEDQLFGKMHIMQFCISYFKWPCLACYSGLTHQGPFMDFGCLPCVVNNLDNKTLAVSPTKTTHKSSDAVHM